MEQHLRKLIVAISTLLFQNTIDGQAPDWEWTQNLNANSGSQSNIAIDASGNVYVACGFNTANVIVGSTNLINAGTGTDDILIVKYNASGSIIWAKSAGGNSTDLPLGIATDISGNIYITGYFKSSTINFGGTILSNSSDNDFFIAKYDASGEVLWAKGAGGIKREEGRAISVDAVGNIYVTGMFFSASIVFGSATLNNTNNLTSGDAFIVKYDASGNVLWATSSGGISEEGPNAIAVDQNGNVLITGYFTSPSAIFGGITLTRAGSSSDMFIAKYDDSGSVIWAKNSLGSHSGAEGVGIVADASGNICVTGGFDGNINFGGTAVTSTGGTDIFIAKFDETGNEIWSKKSGGNNNDSPNGLAIDAVGYLYITGGFQSASIIFGNSNLTNANTTNSDFFVAAYNLSGNALWAKSAGGNLPDQGYDIVSDFSGKVNVTGGFASTTTFAQPGIFVGKISACHTAQIETVTECGPYLWNGTVYTTSGTYVYTATNAAGCDSVVTLHLTINNTSSSFNVSVCDSYTLPWGGIVTTSGEYTHTYETINGCDSIVTANVTINHSSTSSTTVTACDQYLWNGVLYTTPGNKTYTTTNAAGCDSIATLYLAINHSTTSSTTVTACDQYLWNGVVYTTSGDKTYTTTNAAGCDSIATLHLTINHSTTSGTTATACDQYLWNGVVYTTSGDKTYTTMNAAGCDSIATLHLTINHSTASGTTVTACDQYLWNGVVYTTSGDKTYTTTNAAGCDSIATLHLTINHSTTSSTTVTACGQYLWNGVVYTTSGDKIYTTTNTAGCDSIATLHLTIINGPTVPLITCPPGSPFTRSTNASCNYTIVDGEFNATATATCGTPTLGYVLTGATTGAGSATLSGIVLNIGITTISWTATNGSSTSTCSFSVNVVDNQAPVITCPVNISTTLKGKNCNTKIKMLNPSYADNCGPITTLTWVMSGATSGSSPATGINNLGSQTFNAGVTTVVYTAKDAAGNSASCSFTVSVVNPNCPNSPITRISTDLVKTKEFSIRDLTTIVNPNPSANYFTLRIESDNLEQKVSLRIFDLLGGLVETRNNLNADQTLQIGHNYKSGIYMAEIIQGNRRRVVKLIKL